MGVTRWSALASSNEVTPGFVWAPQLPLGSGPPRPIWASYQFPAFTFSKDVIVLARCCGNSEGMSDDNWWLNLFAKRIENSNVHAEELARLLRLELPAVSA